MYLTYEKYISLGGTLDEIPFNDLCFRAKTLVDTITFNRLSKDNIFPEAVQRLTKLLVETLQKQDGAMSLGNDNTSEQGVFITSQANDGVSASYNRMSAEDFYLVTEKSMQSAIKQYLQGVTNEAGKLLLYRGLYPDE